MKRIVASGLTRAARFFDDAVPAEDLQAFIRDELAAAESHEHLLSDAARRNFQIARSLSLGRSDLIPPVMPLAHALQWKRRLEAPNVIVNGVVARRTGSALHALDLHDAERGFVDLGLELLMRHVEVKRKGSLRLFSPRASADLAWLERHDIALLLITAATKRQDLRFLNTALKLNDWAFREYEGRPTASDRRSRYLLALCAQETAMKAVACV